MTHGKETYCKKPAETIEHHKRYGNMICEECVMIVNDESMVYNEYTKAVNMLFFSSLFTF